MNTNSRFIWSFNVWPDNAWTDITNLLAINTDTAFLMDRAKIRRQAFAIGFFGFHYIHAVNENEGPLQRESLQILRKLLDASNLDASLIKQSHASEKQSYSEFWDNVLQKISLALGDLQGSHVQHGVKLSFWLAAVHAYLHGVLKCRGSVQVTKALAILESWQEHLLTSAHQAEVPDRTLQLLIKLSELIENSKSNSTAQKCQNTLEIALRELLLPDSLTPPDCTI